MLMMCENGIRGGMCNAVYRYAKANNKYIKNFDKNIPSSYLVYLDANNLQGWAMSQKLPVNDLEWIETNDLSTFNENFIKNYDKNSDTGSNIFLKQIQSIQRNYLINIKTYHSYLKE